MFFEVESEASNSVFKFDDFVCHRPGQASDVRNSVSDVDDAPNFFDVDLCLVVLNKFF